ncbi:MAG: N-acetyl-gamma-glutamyl-phosphate reductase [Nitrospirae bacterium]|nr:N-acetyl-gamma-glutamyl-phosphate reductase [Nitrospirota bacterium]MBI5696110.1 N-acetyl-gamma-glutamyl-phosphate reductase [Nitrospirota bacterium]
MIRVAVVGSSGYAGGELLRILLGHKEVQVTAVTSEKSAGQHIAFLFPHLGRLCNLTLEKLDPTELANKADLVFLAVPHKEAFTVAAKFVGVGVRVVDLSADLRFRDTRLYEEWYEVEHEQPGLAHMAVYGLTELYRDEIKRARAVGNPGCYPTGALLALAPLVKEGLVELDSIIVDSKSGVSGAGRTPGLTYHYPEANEGMMAYKIGTHRHTPEIEQELTNLAGSAVVVSFTPHLTPMNRGILTTAYAKLKEYKGPETLRKMYAKFYKDAFFVRVMGKGAYPNVNAVRGSNFCDIGLYSDLRTGRVVVTSAIDNLVKGAAGQAVQNMNVMCGFDETEGLKHLGMFP